MIRSTKSKIRTKPIRHRATIKAYPNDFSNLVLRNALKKPKLQFSQSLSVEYKSWLRMFGFVQFIRVSHLTLSRIQRSKLKAVVKGNLSNDRLPKGWLRANAAVALRQIEKKIKRK